jgi:hypothetical protein
MEFATAPQGKSTPAGSRKAILLAEKLDSPAREDLEFGYHPVRDIVASRPSFVRRGSSQSVLSSE